MAETRIITTALDYVGVEYTYEEVSVANGENKEQKWLNSVNPAGQVPCIRHNDVLVAGGYPVLLGYLSETFPKFNSLGW